MGAWSYVAPRIATAARVLGPREVAPVRALPPPLPCLLRHLVSASFRPSPPPPAADIRGPPRRRLPCHWLRQDPRPGVRAPAQGYLRLGGGHPCTTQ